MINLAKKLYDRELIIQKAFDLALNKGIYSLSMRMIARELGCSVMPIYDSFDSKDDLIFALCDYAITSTFQDLQQYDFVERHLRMLEFGLKYPKFYLDFVKLNKVHSKDEDIFANLVIMMRKDQRIKHLSALDLFKINGQIEIFIVGVIFVNSLKSNIDDIMIGYLKEATVKFIDDFINGYSVK